MMLVSNSAMVALAGIATGEKSLTRQRRPRTVRIRVERFDIAIGIDSA